MKGRDHSQHTDVHGDSMKMDLREVSGRVWNGFIWLRMGTGGGALVNIIINLQLS
jgi:hypothetical protein